MTFGCRLARGLDLKSIMDYFTWDCRFNDEYIYDYIKKKLQIVKTIHEDSVQRQVHLQLYLKKNCKQYQKSHLNDEFVNNYIKENL